MNIWQYKKNNNVNTKKVAKNDKVRIKMRKNVVENIKNEKII